MIHRLITIVAGIMDDAPYLVVGIVLLVDPYTGGLGFGQYTEWCFTTVLERVLVQVMSW